MSKPFWLHFLNDRLQMHIENLVSHYNIFTVKTKLPTSTHDEYTPDHFGNQQGKDTVVMIQMHFP
jgi:hypothetical protein